MFEVVGSEPTFDLAECGAFADSAEDMLDPAASGGAYSVLQSTEPCRRSCVLLASLAFAGIQLSCGNTNRSSVLVF